MPSADIAAIHFIASRLGTDATLATLIDVPLANLAGRIWDDVAPNGTEEPYIWISPQTPDDVRGASGQALVFTDMDLLIRVVKTTWDTGELVPIADRVHELLQLAQGTTTMGTVFGITRRRPFRLTDTNTTPPTRYLGGMYQVFSRGTDER